MLGPDNHTVSLQLRESSSQGLENALHHAKVLLKVLRMLYATRVLFNNRGLIWKFRMPLHRVAWSHANELNTQGPRTLVSSVLGLPIR